MRRARPFTLTALAASATMLLALGARAQQPPELGPPPPPPPDYAPSPEAPAAPVAPGELGPPPPPPPGAVAPPPIQPPPAAPSSTRAASAPPAMPPPPWWAGQGTARGGRVLSSSEGPPDADTELVRKSPGMMATGIVFTSGGGIAALVGVFGILTTPSYSYSSGPYATANDKTPFIGSTVAGILAIGLGIPLTVVGARKITRAERERADYPAPRVSLAAGMGRVGIAGAW